MLMDFMDNVPCKRKRLKTKVESFYRRKNDLNN